MFLDNENGNEEAKAEVATGGDEAKPADAGAENGTEDQGEKAAA